MVTIADQYVFSENLGYINEGITIHLWGPSDDDTIKTRLLELGHKLATVPYERSAFQYLTYCLDCKVPLAKILDNMYFGVLLENACKAKN